MIPHSDTRESRDYRRTKWLDNATITFKQSFVSCEVQKADKTRFAYVTSQRNDLQ
jgi:hypothetical protein